MRDKAHTRLERCRRLREIKAPLIVIKNEQFMLARNRAGFKSRGTMTGRWASPAFQRVADRALDES